MIKIADFSKTVSSDDNAHRDSDDSEPEMFMPRPEPQGRYIDRSKQYTDLPRLGEATLSTLTH